MNAICAQHLLHPRIVLFPYPHLATYSAMNVGPSMFKVEKNSQPRPFYLYPIYLPAIPQSDPIWAGPQTATGRASPYFPSR